MEFQMPGISRGILRATLSGDGRPGPIEERIGRRLVRVVDPDSEEGQRLLRDGAVDLIGPGGDRFGRIGLAEAMRRLEERLATRLAVGSSDREALEEGLTRLRSHVDRIGRS